MVTSTEPKPNPSSPGLLWPARGYPRCGSPSLSHPFPIHPPCNRSTLWQGRKMWTFHVRCLVIDLRTVETCAIGRVRRGNEWLSWIQRMTKSGYQVVAGLLYRYNLSLVLYIPHITPVKASIFAYYFFIGNRLTLVALFKFIQVLKSWKIVLYFSNYLVLFWKPKLELKVSASAKRIEI